MKTVVLSDTTHRALMGYKLEHGLRSIDAVIGQLTKPTTSNREITNQLSGLIKAKEQTIDDVLEMEDWI